MLIQVLIVSCNQPEDRSEVTRALKSKKISRRKLIPLIEYLLCKHSTVASECFLEANCFTPTILNHIFLTLCVTNAGLSKGSLIGLTSSRSASINTVMAPSSGPPSAGSLTSILSITNENRPSLAPARPKCNSILHLFGEWLFEAAHIGSDMWLQSLKSELLIQRYLKCQCKQKILFRASNRSQSSAELDDNRSEARTLDFATVLVGVGNAERLDNRQV